MSTPQHLNALRAFEASARHQSFAAAANELNVTSAAVGQLVRGLEEWLGVTLFVRSHSGKHRLQPTDAALRALPVIQSGMHQLKQGLDMLAHDPTAGVLTVTVSPAFAAKWLLPRLDRFQATCPDTDLRLETSLKPADFQAQQIDIGVRYGAGRWPGLVAEKLMDEEIYPVCSPAFLQRHPMLQASDLYAAHLQELPLIHDLSMDSHSGFANWEGWFDAAGAASVEPLAQPVQPLSQQAGDKRRIRINNSAAVLQAAADGQGIALARSVMAQDDIRSGRLVRLLPHIHWQTPLAYYLVYRSSSANLPALLAFRQWIQEEATRQH